MNLNDFAKELVAKNHFIKASFGGFAGAGKTRTATEFVIGCYKQMKLTKPVLLIDNEKGSRFLHYISKYQKLSLKFIREFEDKIDWSRLQDNEYLIIDIVRNFIDKFDLKKICQRKDFKSLSIYL